MNATKLIVGLIIVLALGYYVKKQFFPDDEGRIRARLAELAEKASLEKNEDRLSRLARARSVGKFFTDTVQLTFSTQNWSEQRVVGRTELEEKIFLARSRLYRLSFAFMDTTVKVSSHEADVHTTLKAEGERPSQEGDFIEALEMKMKWKKEQGEWKIAQAQNLNAVEY